MAVNIVILASGSGSNAENIYSHLKNRDDIRITAFLSNNPNAYVAERAKKLGVSFELFDRATLQDEQRFTDLLSSYRPDMIILAGFLLKVPPYLIRQYPDKIINIHPALLPDFGGKGMYGQHVHEAVIKSGVGYSGISIHLVNENYDEGRILFQASCEIVKEDTPDSLAAKIHQLEYRYFPQVIVEYIEENLLKSR